MWTAFDYLYRDADNFKAFGTIAITGGLSDADRDAIKFRLDGTEYFVAEQVGIPPLYEQLYRWSGGRTFSDHCWHEFVSFRDLDGAPEKGALTLDAATLIARFTGVSEWDCTLSPNFDGDFHNVTGVRL
jgi:hypothetical protein